MNAEGLRDLALFVVRDLALFVVRDLALFSNRR
jgi:hypothetical protein